MCVHIQKSIILYSRFKPYSHNATKSFPNKKIKHEKVPVDPNYYQKINKDWIKRNHFYTLMTNWSLKLLSFSHVWKGEGREGKREGGNVRNDNLDRKRRKKKHNVRKKKKKKKLTINIIFLQSKI